MGRKATNTVPYSTEAVKRKIKEAAGRRIEYRVAGRPGLVLMTQTSGVGVFYLFYTPKSGRRPRKLRLGEFGPLSLADAAWKAEEARVKIEKGDDPAKPSLTFRALAERFLAEGTLSAKSKVVYSYCLNRDAYPLIGSKPANAVTDGDIADICARIRARGKLVQPQRTKSMIGGVYKWGMKFAGLKSNPARLVSNQLALPSRSTRMPTDAEIATLWAELDARARLSKAMKIIIKLAILTGQRRDEVAAARVSEVDLSANTWRIAADAIKAQRIVTEGRMKSGREQTVYLSTQAAALFDDAIKTCSDGDYVFPTAKQGAKVPYIRGDSITHTMRRLGVGDFSIHDMRRAMGTYLKNAGCGREIRDLMLHHKDTSVDAVYSDAASMEPQCRRAWQLWADHVERTVSAPP